MLGDWQKEKPTFRQKRYEGTSKFVVEASVVVSRLNHSLWCWHPISQCQSTPASQLFCFQFSFLLLFLGRQRKMA